MLGVSFSRPEAEVHWREFLDGLRKPNLHGKSMIISDDHAGLKQASRAVFPGIPWQRCECHLQRNAIHHVPSIAMREPTTRALRSIFNAPNQLDAERLLDRFVRSTRTRRQASLDGPKKTCVKASACSPCPNGIDAGRGPRTWSSA